MCLPRYELKLIDIYGDRMSTPGLTIDPFYKLVTHKLAIDVIGYGDKALRGINFESIVFFKSLGKGASINLNPYPHRLNP